MSVDKFRFVSPGVQVAEIDASRRTRPTAEPGPVIIGRFERGITMRPVKVDSLGELTEIFGDTITGRESGDISRFGNFSAPSYAAFAANAWLANNGGATIVRLVGKESDNLSVGYGEAGWVNTDSDTNSATGRGGAWGLWVLPSGSSTISSGTLGAVFYCQASSSVVLSGALAGNPSNSDQLGCTLIESSTGKVKVMVIKGVNDASSSIAGTTDAEATINFNPESRLFIRKAFNTTPYNVNDSVVDNATHADAATYWLGETYEDEVQRLIAAQGANSEVYMFTAPMYDASANSMHDKSFDAQPCKSGWVFGQDVSTDYAAYLATNMPKLFRFVSLEEGTWTQDNLKVSIRNIRLPNAASNAQKYGSFDVVVRKLRDNDSAPETVETYTNCNLNAASTDYIAAKIGDQEAVWTDAEKRYRYFGTYPNLSKYLRVEMASGVEEGSITEEIVPFGFYGLPRPPTVSFTRAESMATKTLGATAYILGNGDAAAVEGAVLARNATATVAMDAGLDITASLSWPTHKLVRSASHNMLSEPKDRYFGLVTSRQTGEHTHGTLFDESVLDLAKVYSKTLSADDWDESTLTRDYFTLDDVSMILSPHGWADGLGACWAQGDRARGYSLTADSSSASEVLDQGYDKFTMPLYGGFDGLDTMHIEPLINNQLLSSVTTRTSYEYNTLIRAIDSVADPEMVDMNLLVMPGIWRTGITDHMINTCERRADAMAVIDIEKAWTPRHESDELSAATRNAAGGVNTVQNAVNTVKAKGYNSSYAACYYPWVQVRAPVSGLPTYVPPSVVALGAMSYGDATQAVWFAPAGFTRGGLSEGRGGLPVTAVTQRLSSKERDKLYENNINPIAHFPAEGIVIFGQKTLQAFPSALDRINVRRLMIFLKKSISRIASRLLFSPNVSDTWGRFTSQVAPFLDGVKSGFGIEDFKVVLDSSTTTADLIDRNIMYAKIYIKPTKAIEFIAIDFIITSQGASFDD